MYQKYIIVARMIIIFVTLFIIGLTVFYIIKKHSGRLVVHLIISLFLVACVLFMSEESWYCKLFIPCDWNICKPKLDSFCATNQSMYNILHPLSKDTQISDIETWHKNQWYNNLNEVYESDWYKEKYQECIDSYWGKRCWVPEQMCTLDRLISGNFCD